MEYEDIAVHENQVSIRQKRNKEIKI